MFEDLYDYARSMEYIKEKDFFRFHDPFCTSLVKDTKSFGPNCYKMFVTEEESEQEIANSIVHWKYGVYLFVSGCERDVLVIFHEIFNTDDDLDNNKKRDRQVFAVATPSGFFAVHEMEVQIQVLKRTIKEIRETFDLLHNEIQKKKEYYGITE